MDKGFLIRTFGLALIPLCVHGIMSLMMRENEKEEISNLQKERIVVRLPKAMRWVAVIGMLIFATFPILSILNSIGIDPPL